MHMVARKAHLVAKIAAPKNSIPRYIRFQALRGARGWYSDCVGGVWKLRERVWCVCVYDHAFPEGAREIGSNACQGFHS